MPYNGPFGCPLRMEQRPVGQGLSGGEQTGRQIARGREATAAEVAASPSGNDQELMMLRPHTVSGETAVPTGEVVLVFPPPWVPFQPYASLPALSGALSGAGIRHRCIDASLEFFEEFLAPDALERCYRRLRRLGHIDGEPAHQPSIVTLHAEDVIDRIGQVSEILRGEDFYDPARRSLALNLVSRSLEIVGGSFPGCDLGLDRATGPWNHRSSRDLLRAAVDPPANPFLELYERRVLHKILEPAAQVVAISIVFADQAFPALLLARMIRERSPMTRLILGGPFLTANRDALQSSASPLIEELADFVVLGEGETVFVDLVQDLLSGSVEPGAVPSRERVLIGRLEDLNSLHRPAYENLPLERYLSPEPVLTVLTSRGCYWNRCEFCDIQGIREQGFYRAAKPETVLAILDGLSATTGARCFAFWDDAVPPRTLRDLSRLLRDSGRDYHWYAQTRADDVLDDETCRAMYESGCRQVYVGIETGSRRLARLMRKGIDLERVRKAARRLTEAGIAVSAGFFFGFPGEDEADVEDTLGFMLQDPASIYPSSASVGAFSLRKGSPIHRCDNEAGIHVIEPERHDLALDLAFELEEPAALDRFQLAAGVRRFLDDRGFDEDRFGPHYLLYQIESGDSTPIFVPPTQTRRTADYGLSEDARWQRTDASSTDDLIFYVPATASLVRVSAAKVSAGSQARNRHEEPEELVRDTAASAPGSLRRLLVAGLLVPRPARAAAIAAGVTSPGTPNPRIDTRSLS